MPLYFIVTLAILALAWSIYAASQAPPPEVPSPGPYVPYRRKKTGEIFPSLFEAQDAACYERFVDCKNCPLHGRDEFSCVSFCQKHPGEAALLLGVEPAGKEVRCLKYMLISACGREILTELFPTIEEAQGTMHQEMEDWGGVDSSVFTATELDGGDFGFGPYGGYLNDRVNHEDYDWLIVQVQ